MYLILGKYKNFEVEEVDETETLEDAEYLLGEYQLAYGDDWVLTIEKD